MMPIPTKVKNVSVFAYFDPREPLVEEILTGASGTYSVGTLLTNAYYNLNLDNEGKKENPLFVHGRYYATGQTESGHNFRTPWMYCLNNSDHPEFGRTIRFGTTGDEASGAGGSSADISDFITLGPLTDITVSQLFTAPAIGQRVLISNGDGNIIATRIGTPHEMGVMVKKGDRHATITPGMKNIIISGKTKDGKRFSQTGYTAVSGGEPAIFLKEFVIH